MNIDALGNCTKCGKKIISTVGCPCTSSNPVGEISLPQSCVLAPPQPIVAVAAILTSHDMILISKRLAGKLQNTYAAPGGHLEMESFAHAACRELKEETGLEAKEEDCEVIKVDQEFDINYCCVIIFVRVRKWNGHIQNKENKQGPWEWHSMNHLPPSTLGPLKKVAKEIYESGDWDDPKECPTCGWSVERDGSHICGPTGSTGPICNI